MCVCVCVCVKGRHLYLVVKSQQIKDNNPHIINEILNY